MIYSKISQKIDVEAGDKLQLCSPRARTAKRERTNNNKPSKSQKVRSTSLMNIMAIRVVEFSNGGYKIRFLPKNQHTQRKLLNFEFWINGELSKSAKI